MAASRGPDGIGIGRRERELLGALLASLSLGLLLISLAFARSLSGFGSNAGVLASGGWTSGSGSSFIDAFVAYQSPLHVPLLVGALVLVGQGAWDEVSTAGRIGRSVVLGVGSVVGVASVYAAILATGLRSAELGTTDQPVDGRIAAALTHLAVAAAVLVAARLAFGLLPMGGAGAHMADEHPSASDAVGDAEEA